MRFLIRLYVMPENFTVSYFDACATPMSVIWEYT